MYCALMFIKRGFGFDEAIPYKLLLVGARALLGMIHDEGSPAIAVVANPFVAGFLEIWQLPQLLNVITLKDFC